MNIKILGVPVCALALLAGPAWSQTEDAQTGGTQAGQQTGQMEAGQTQAGTAMTEDELGEADRAAETMIGRLYVREVPTHWTPNEVVARLQELGYTNINDFDVEWNHYEVEATAPNGDDVEIEVDPITGQILDIEENWF